jgi:hypothetical protein
MPLGLRTIKRRESVSPVLVSRSGAEQKVTFDGEDTASFTRKRCAEIGCPRQVAAQAKRGQAPALPPRMTLGAGKKRSTGKHR